jgi:hypothetical protein
MNDQTETNPDPINTRIPSQIEIETLLGKIKPLPSVRFHQSMAIQPWNQRACNPIIGWLRLHRLPVTLSLAFITVVVISLALPSWEVLADRIALFFAPSSSEQVIIQVPINDINGQKTSFQGSIQEMVELAGFEVKTPASDPKDYIFTGADYNPDRQAVTLNYESKAGFLLRISQRPVGVEYQSISINATVETVQIGTVVGEYVVGGWKAIQTQTEAISPPVTITLQAVWDPKANIYFLRWQENDILYQILFSGDDPTSESYLTKNDMIAIAEDLQ